MQIKSCCKFVNTQLRFLFHNRSCPNKIKLNRCPLRQLSTRSRDDRDYYWPQREPLKGRLCRCTFYTALYFHRVQLLCIFKRSNISKHCPLLTLVGITLFPPPRYRPMRLDSLVYGAPPCRIPTFPITFQLRDIWSIIPFIGT